MLIMKSHRMTSQRHLVKTHEILEDRRSTVDSLRRCGKKVCEGDVGASVLRKRKLVEDGGGYIMCDRLCSFLKQVWERAERAKAAVSAERSLGKVLSTLFNGEGLTSFVSCLDERILVDGVRVADEEVQMVSVRSGLISEVYFLSVDSYSEFLNVLRAWRTKECVMRKQRVYADPESGAHTKLLSTFVFIRGESDVKENVRATKVLLLTRCLKNGESEGKRACICTLHGVRAALG